jgi:hypothetical protein
VTSRKQGAKPRKFDIRTAIVAGDAFIAHSEAFTRELIGKDSNFSASLVAHHLGFAIAAATELALGLELYIKALRTLAGLSIPQKHHLFALYKDLPETMRNQIEAQYEKTRPPIAIGKSATIMVTIAHGSARQEQYESPKSIPVPDNSLKAVLKRSSDVFQTWRYLHEGGRDNEVVTYVFEFELLNTAAKSIRTPFKNSRRFSHYKLDLPAFFAHQFGAPYIAAGAEAGHATVRHAPLLPS